MRDDEIKKKFWKQLMLEMVEADHDSMDERLSDKSLAEAVDNATALPSELSEEPAEEDDEELKKRKGKK